MLCVTSPGRWPRVRRRYCRAGCAGFRGRAFPGVADGGQTLVV